MGASISEISYTPYGTPFQMGTNGLPVAGAFTPATPMAFGGRYGGYRDAETGLVLMRTRYYAPSLGRFTAVDPSGFSGGINSLFGYCGGDPINFIDPLGTSGALGFSGFVDSVLMGGEASRFGEALGNYETGKGGLAPVLGHGAATAGLLVLNAIGIGEAVSGGLAVVNAARFASESVAFSGKMTIGLGAENGMLAASKVRPLDTMFDVIGHGTPDAMLTAEGWTNHKTIANMIAKDPQFQNQPIRLIACETGKKPNGFAQNLANELGVPVAAPNNIIRVHRDTGEIRIRGRNGDWNIFYPQGR